MRLGNIVIKFLWHLNTMLSTQKFKKAIACSSFPTKYISFVCQEYILHHNVSAAQLDKNFFRAIRNIYICLLHKQVPKKLQVNIANE